MQPRPILLWFVVVVLWSPLIALVTGPDFFFPLYPLIAYVVLVVVITFAAVFHTVRRTRPP